MKNIHILPTDKPSRLFKLYSQEDELLLGNSSIKLCTEDKNLLQLPQNIYITSDEEIKEVDYGLGKNGSIYKFNKTTTLHCVKMFYCKKIILTTDQDLIKDGVQAIDNEFLEWFVKNSSCEEVGISTYHVKGDISGKLHYKIIIPKEEPTFANMKCTCMRFEANCFSGRCRNCGFPPKEKLSTKLHKGEVVDESYPEEFKHECKVLSKEYIMENRSNAYDFIDFDKQETLEEASIKYAMEEYGSIELKDYTPQMKLNYVRLVTSYKQGAKWQQQQNKNKYNEEDLDVLRKFMIQEQNFSKSCLDVFIEQFKKK
jgi:hypothetical protein